MLGISVDAAGVRGLRKRGGHAHITSSKNGGGPGKKEEPGRLIADSTF